MTAKGNNRIRGLLVGVNRFPKLAPKQQLLGCVRDTENVSNLLINKFDAHAYDIRQLHDERATRKAVLGRLEELVRKTREKEVAIFHISTHGSLITRREHSGALKDHASEILCLSSIDPNLDDQDSYISDSDLNEILCKMHPGALFVAIMDACHAGATVIGDIPPKNSPSKRRFLKPPHDLKHRDEARKIKFSSDHRHRLFEHASRNAPGHVLVLTACAANETSDDTQFGDKTEGAFTHFLCEALTNNAGDSYATLFDTIQAGLQGNGDKQTPEFMPALFFDSEVFRPLTTSKFGTYPPGKRAEITVQSAGKNIDTVNTREEIAEKFANNINYKKLYDRLIEHGFEVQTLHCNRPEDLEVHVEHGHAALLLEYSEDIAVWTKPAGKVTARASSGKDNSNTTTLHHFVIEPLPQGTRNRDLKSSIESIFHVVTHPIEAVTRTAVSVIENAVYDEGLYQLQDNSFYTGNLLKNPTSIITPPDQNNPRAVLFIHGVLSSIEGCYEKPPIVGLLGYLQKRYIVLGYNHRSASISVSDIAQQLENRLRQCISDETKLYIVSHSQGGVIARQLGQLRQIERIISFGSPHQGTNLANKLDKFVTILGALPLLPSAVSVLFKILKYIDSPDVIPGFLDMEVNGPCIAGLNSAKVDSTLFYCGTSNFKPGPSVGTITRIAEEADSKLIFDGTENDLVIDTENMVPPEGFNLADRLDYGSDDHVIHTKYFEQISSGAFIRKYLP